MKLVECKITNFLTNNAKGVPSNFSINLSLISKNSWSSTSSAACSFFSGSYFFEAITNISPSSELESPPNMSLIASFFFG
jgi:hypothetical protein